MPISAGIPQFARKSAVSQLFAKTLRAEKLERLQQYHLLDIKSKIRPRDIRSKVGLRIGPRLGDMFDEGAVPGNPVCKAYGSPICM